ncbi:FmdB family zinc ribbon protein [Polymorphospora sp. NPDC051019]|uniref:FmdB family zinc ribbon protein n=1 Tax=unclassified Polymorphospora TaxID=2685497 RepID=UPI0034482B36
MPTYQYACTACGHQLEAVQSFADEPLTECPACEGRLRKLFNSVGIVFKGSGFYRTDSRSGSSESATSGKPAKAESSGSSGSGSNGSGGKDSAGSGSKEKPASSGTASSGSSSSSGGSSSAGKAAT